MKLVTFGEGMIEIVGAIGPTGRIAYGGDTLNVAVALARLGLAPAFLTALGTDPWSDELVALWAEAGVDTRLIARHPGRVPGLYGIRVDAQGERSFTYWRDRSAARALLDMPEAEALLAQAAEADLLFLSGITLSLYDAVGRARIADLADAVRERGGTVAFDGNYRPRGWASEQEARAAFADFASHVTLALPTADDEALLHDREESPEAIAARWHAAGASEVAVKLGPKGALVSDSAGMEILPTEALDAIDTSGAGDAFDAGYIAARLGGQAPADAARFGHRIAGETLLHPGAIPPAAAIRALMRNGFASP
jgi:2-dehydro-3-deoxygluconokinase